MDGVEMARRVSAGELTPAELRAAFERALEATNPALNALGDRAEAPIHGPEEQGPLWGVPTLTKELLAVPGLPWTLGSRLMRQNPAPEASPYTQALLSSGVHVMGSTTASELGLLGSTESLLRGVTHNPWSPSLSAGGSSGGSAAMVAAGVVPFAHANDGGGSIRGPAAMNGVFGFMPTRGRCPPSVPPEGFGKLLVDHVISWTVRDSAAVLQATQRTDAEAPVAPMAPVEGPAPRRLEIAAWSTSLLGAEPAAPVLAAWRRTLELCRGLGHEVAEVAPPAVSGRVLSDAFFAVAGLAVRDLSRMVTPMLGRPPGPDELEPFSLELAARVADAPEDAGARALAALEHLGPAYLARLECFDVALTPTFATLPWSIGHLAPTLDAETLLARTEEAVAYTPIHNVAGCPAMSVPLEMHEGVPVGLHFAAAPGADATLLHLAFELEDAAPWRDRRPTGGAWPKS